MYKFGTTSIRRMEGVDERLVECVTRALTSSKRYDYSIPWMGGMRTPKEQLALFKNGASQLDGYRKQSYHQTGNAIDVIPYNVNPEYNVKAHMYFAELMFSEWQRGLYTGEYRGVLEWGGHWTNFNDMPHWQIKT